MLTLLHEFFNGKNYTVDTTSSNVKLKYVRKIWTIL